MLGVPQECGVVYHDGGNRPQLLDDLSRLVEAADMGVAGGEKAVRRWEAWIVLDREE